MRRIAAAVTCWLWLAPCVAQDPAPDEVAQGEAVLRALVRRAQHRLGREQAVECPFEKPRLGSTDPMEVAWAAEQLTVEDGRQPQVTADLIAAMRLLSAGKTEEHRRAMLHLLHAALQHRLAIPLADLRFRPEGRTRIPWIELQARGTAKDGRDVFALFHSLDEKTDAGWEVVGGSLAMRGHAAFAIELRTQMVPRLRVFASRRSPNKNEPKVVLERPGPLAGFPPPPTYYWTRDSSGFVTATTANASSGDDPKGCEVDPLRTDRTKLRWLARLVGEPDAVIWAARFEARFAEQDMGDFRAFAEAAEQRATASLLALDQELRKRFKIPERLLLPSLEVVWEDFRSERLKKAQPFPKHL